MENPNDAERYGYEGEMIPLKCDELKAYKADVTIPVYGTIADAEVYLKEGVDDAIAELKEFAEDACIERDDNQTAIDELQAEIAELKAKLDKVTAERDGNQVCIDALKAKLEDAKATHYAESMDVGMRERRLKSALWLARAERAKEKQQLFHFSLDYEKLCIDGFYDPYSGRRELSPKQWIKVFNKVEVKCLKKAEEYK